MGEVGGWERLSVCCDDMMVVLGISLHVWLCAQAHALPQRAIGSCQGHFGEVLQLCDLF